jgi:hypothetical protein
MFCCFYFSPKQFLIIFRKFSTCRYATSAGTASTADFTSAANTITFQPGGLTSSVLQISITDDSFVEASEQFRVILQLQDAENTVIGNTGEATVTINDNDS